MRVKSGSSPPVAPAPPPGRQSTSRYAGIAAALSLVLLTGIVYANSLHGKFVFDDQQIVFQNPALMNVRTLGDVMSFGTGWRQLLFLTYGLNYYWSGLDTFSYHAVNVLLHAVNVLLVYAIIRIVLAGRCIEAARYRACAPRNAGFPAFAGAAIFSVHPLLSSAVSYIAGRSSVLCATFYFAAILLFLKGLDSTVLRRRVLYMLLAGIAGFLAFQAKQEAIALPLFLAAVVYLRMEKHSWRWIAALATVPVVTVVLMRDQLITLFETVSSNRVLVSAGFERVLPPAEYFRTYISSIFGYFFPRFIFPDQLSADPYIAPVAHWYSSEFLLSVFLVGALAWLAVSFYQRVPLLSLGIGALLVSPLAAYAAIPLADVVLEHRIYIPSLGVALVGAAWFGKISDIFGRSGWAILATVVAVFAVVTVNRNPVFANNIALWEDAERKAPLKPRPHFNLGQAYQEGNRLSDAIREYEHALRLKPDIHAAYSNIAAIYLDQKQFDKGEEMLLKVTGLAPEFTEGFINLGVLYIRRQQPDKALTALDRALQISPQSFAAHFNRGEALTQKQDFKAAVESYSQAVQLRPDLHSFRLTLAAAYVRAGDRASAEQEFMKLIQTPVAPEAYRNLGVLSGDAGKPDQALEYLRKATSLRNPYPEAQHDIGIVYLRRQQYPEAIRQFLVTLEQQPDYGPAILNLALSYQLKGDPAAARQTLQGFVDRSKAANSTYVTQARERLRALP